MISNGATDELTQKPDQVVLKTFALVFSYSRSILDVDRALRTIAEIDEDWVTPLNTRMEAIGGSVVREWRSDFEEAEIAKETAADKATTSGIAGRGGAVRVKDRPVSHGAAGTGSAARRHFGVGRGLGQGQAGRPHQSQ